MRAAKCPECGRVKSGRNRKPCKRCFWNPRHVARLLKAHAMTQAVFAIHIGVGTAAPGRWLAGVEPNERSRGLLDEALRIVKQKGRW